MKNLFGLEVTDETKQRKKKFFALLLTVIIAVLPTAEVFAANITYNYDGALGNNNARVNTLIGRQMNPGDEFTFHQTAITGRLRVTYAPAGAANDAVSALTDTYPNGDAKIAIANCGLSGFQHWKITDARQFIYDGTNATQSLHLTLTAVVPEPEKEKEEVVEEKEPFVPIDWNAIGAYYVKNNTIDYKAKYGRQPQGEACRLSFEASIPKGWSDGFSFSMSYDDKHTTDLKDGTLLLYIPGRFQKEGRKYAVMAMDKYGVVHIYHNTSKYPFVFTSPLNFEGYAFELIYMD